jgi:hypothetical protein
MTNYEYYEGQLYTETYKGYDLRVENSRGETDWVCSALIPERNTWEDILFVSNCGLDSAIEGFREEVDGWDPYPSPGH